MSKAAAQQISSEEEKTSDPSQTQQDTPQMVHVFSQGGFSQGGIKGGTVERRRAGVAQPTQRVVATGTKIQKPNIPNRHNRTKRTWQGLVKQIQLGFQLGLG